MKLILLIDIGNTNIHLALYDGSTIQKVFSLASNLGKTIFNYYLDMKNLFDFENIHDCVLSSVVPYLTEEFKKLSNISNCNVLVVQKGTKTGVNLLIDNPNEVGSDLISLCAAIKDNNNYLLIDLGTANKYIYYSKNNFLGVVISAGIKIALDSLTAKTALLPSISLIKPNKILGKNTISSMQSGAIYGAVSEIDGLIDLIKKEINDEFSVIITGGHSDIIYPLLRNRVIYDEKLLFKGLINIYERNK